MKKTALLLLLLPLLALSACAAESDQTQQAYDLYQEAVALYESAEYRYSEHNSASEFTDTDTQIGAVFNTAWLDRAGETPRMYRYLGSYTLMQGLTPYSYEAAISYSDGIARSHDLENGTVTPNGMVLEEIRRLANSGPPELPPDILESASVAKTDDGGQYLVLVVDVEKLTDYLWAETRLPSGAEDDEFVARLMTMDWEVWLDDAGRFTRIATSSHYSYEHEQPEQSYSQYDLRSLEVQYDLDLVQQKIEDGLSL